jgi:hypothetical protein
MANDKQKAAIFGGASGDADRKNKRKQRAEEKKEEAKTNLSAKDYYKQGMSKWFTGGTILNPNEEISPVEEKKTKKRRQK